MNGQIDASLYHHFDSNQPRLSISPSGHFFVDILESESLLIYFAMASCDRAAPIQMPRKTCGQRQSQASLLIAQMITLSS